MKVKCIHTGDIHIGMEFKSNNFNENYGKNRRSDVLNTFFRIIDRAKEQKVELLLIAGDVFEEKYCTISDCKLVISKLNELNNTRVVIVSGNHDPIDRFSLYNLGNWGENVYIIDSNKVTNIEFEDINTVVWGFSWDKKEERENLRNKFSQDFKIDTNKINILIVHGDILNKSSNYLPIDKNFINNLGFDYIALGHIHKHQFIDDRISYCGSPEPLNFSESGRHGIVEGVISKNSLDMHFVPFSKREYIKKEVIIDEYMSYLDICEKIKKCDCIENKEKNIYKITIKGIKDYDIKLNVDKLERDLKDEFYYIEIEDNTIPGYDLDEIISKNKDNILGRFVIEMKSKGIQDPVVRDALLYGLDALLDEKVIIK